MTSTTSNIASPYYKPSPSRTIYSDRFIPSRTSSNFSLFSLSTPKSDYATRIHTALFGPESLSVTQDNSVTRRNIFKFKSETRQPLHSLLDEHLHEVIQNPVKPLRRIPEFPYKVSFEFLFLYNICVCNLVSALFVLAINFFCCIDNICMNRFVLVVSLCFITCVFGFLFLCNVYVLFCFVVTWFLDLMYRFGMLLD